MATKKNPGPHDCFAKAEDDEPMFTPLARDPIGMEIVALWASLREHRFASAAVIFGRLVWRAGDLAAAQPDKVYEAYRCAEDMASWREKKTGLKSALDDR